MTRYEEFKLRIMELSLDAPPLTVTTRSLAKRHGLPEPHVRKELLTLADSGFIRLSAWDGERDRSHEEWPDANSFFSHQVRIRVLDAGAQFLSRSASALIGGF